MAESVRSASGTTPGQDPNVSYALGSSPGESARLQRQADELASDSRDLLDRVGLRPGRAVIDLGCGPRGILDLLAERVAPAGRVVGLDADPAHTAMAAEFAAGRGLRGVEIMTADARSTGLAAGSFDLVHARTLLVNLPDPADVAAEMVRLARPGGWVASMEPDTEHGRCYPPHPAFDRLCDIFTVAFRRNGADPWIGRRVPELFRQAGLDDVQVEARVQMYPPGNSRRTVRPDLVRAMRPQVLEMGLASAAELDELDTAARAHLRDPHTVVISGLLFLTWGRKPDHMQHDLLPTRKYRCNINCYGQDPAQEFAGYADRVRRRSHGTVCARAASPSRRQPACLGRPDARFSQHRRSHARPRQVSVPPGVDVHGGERNHAAGPGERTVMAVTADSEPRAGGDSGQRRAAGIYGAIITAAIIAAVGDHLPTLALAVAIVVTLVVYWVAEVYAELLGEHVERGQLPTWPYTRAALAARWPMVSASYVPLLTLVLVRVAGASVAAAANVGLAAAIVLLVFHGWSIGRASKLRGRQLLIVTFIAAALGLVMVLLKDLVLVHLH